VSAKHLEGKRLLAHELTHVVQQNKATSNPNKTDNSLIHTSSYKKPDNLIWRQAVGVDQQARDEWFIAKLMKYVGITGGTESLLIYL
jgi:hypothetical protein